MKIVYFYSPIYEEFHKHISTSMKLANIPCEGIFIDDIHKEKTSKHTFANGQSVKIETLLNSVKDNIGSDIIFIDATTIFNPNTLLNLKDYFSALEPFDLCWQDNIGPYGDYNIGVSKIKCNEKMINFFTDVLTRIKLKKCWDQAACNFVFSEFEKNINFKKFDEKVIVDKINLSVCESVDDAWDLMERNFGNFLIFKHVMTHDNKTPEQISNVRVNVLRKLNLISK